MKSIDTAVKKADTQTLVGWLSNPSLWCPSQRLAIIALLCFTLSLLCQQASDSVADGFAYAGFAAVAGLLFRMCWQRLRNRTTNVETYDHEVETSSTNETITARQRLLFIASLVLTVAVFFWLYLAQIFVIQDPNPESMENPLAVAYAEDALARGIRPSDYFRDDKVWASLKAQDPQQMFSNAANRFKFEWITIAMPFPNLCLIPFVKTAGISHKTIALYSNFFSFVAWAGTVILAWRIGGRWCAISTAAIMMTSLSWLIHVQVGCFNGAPTVFLMVLLGLCLDAYWREGRRWVLFPAGVLLGCMYLTGWIVVAFGVTLTLSVIGLGARGCLREALKDGMFVSLATICTLLLGASLYAARYGYPSEDIHHAIQAQLFGRFHQGEPGIRDLSIAGKTALTCKCLFLDGKMLGHPDKFLEGRPAVPVIFSLLFGMGMLYGVKKRGIADKFSMLWVLIILSVMCIVFVFGHRYAVFAIPAMSVIAARGAIELANDLGNWRGRAAQLTGAGLIALALLTSISETHHDYYVRYTHHKPPEFEMDRMRGHFGFSERLKKTSLATETLVVMNDPIMFPHACFLFNTYGYKYDFVYWSNYFQTTSTAEQVRAWERQQMDRYSSIVYAFSSTTLGDSRRAVILNDWRPFLQAHPEKNPVWSYAYDGRPPSVYVFEVRR